jgi:hypothetical protein
MKTHLVDTFRTLNIVFGAPLVGALIAEYALILPLIRRLPAPMGIESLRFVSARAWRWTPLCGQISIFSGTAIVVLWPWDHDSPAAVTTVVGVALSYTAILVTYVWYRPADRSVRALSLTAEPTEVQARLRAMAQYHAIRTVFYVAGFVCFVLGVVLA